MFRLTTLSPSIRFVYTWCLLFQNLDIRSTIVQAGKEWRREGRIIRKVHDESKTPLSPFLRECLVLPPSFWGVGRPRTTGLLLEALMLKRASHATHWVGMTSFLNQLARPTLHARASCHKVPWASFFKLHASQSTTSPGENALASLQPGVNECSSS
jgi:hypothetical protein